MLNIILLIVAAVAVFGTSGGKPMFMLPFIVYEFLGLMLWVALVTVTVVIMAVYEPGGVDLRSATINILTNSSRQSNPFVKTLLSAAQRLALE